MTDLEQMSELPPDFDGRVRLFPLPELVVFPHAMQPLHIFEPRYLDMLHDALASDRLIAMATLAPGWQKPVCDQPPIEPHVCICRIVSHATTEDDHQNILIVGMRRARLLSEEETERSFRTAQVDTLADIYSADGTATRPQLKRQLLESFRQLIPNVAEVQKNLHELMASQMRLGAVTDIIAFTMQFAAAAKIALLSEPNVDRRARMLIELLDQRRVEESETVLGSGGGSFPPPFSVN